MLIQTNLMQEDTCDQVIRCVKFLWSAETEVTGQTGRPMKHDTDGAWNRLNT